MFTLSSLHNKNSSHLIFKLFSLFILVGVLFGCSLISKNTPKSKVEKLLMSYQNNSESIKIENPVDLNQRGYFMG